ncbi:MAG: SWF/SNF helicase family protein, partial [Acidobacteriia bacterium]|nr:SWF/SNF helicase family protein [Terriglobia bacterium]
PRRAKGEAIRVGPAPDEGVLALVREIATLNPGPAGALIRMVLLTRLASSLPAFRESLSRQEAFRDLALEARQSGTALNRRDFQRLFPRGEEQDLQLALLPLLLPPGSDGPEGDLSALARLRELAHESPDPKVARLNALLTERPAKTIVFTASRATARYLLRSLRGNHRVAVVMGARESEILRAFAPVAAGVAPPSSALVIDVLIATDLASEGLNLQDASRVVNYDLPWTPARLAQRVGRIDRLGSPHARIETVTFLPPPSLAHALRIESRLLMKEKVSRRATFFDWCDRMQALAGPGDGGTACAVYGSENAVLLVMSIGGMTEPLVVRADGVTVHPLDACRILEEASCAEQLPLEAGVVRAAISRAAGMIRRRLSMLARSRWRAGDRDQLSRRLVPMVVGEARRAAPA